jgi:RNA polymerase sigma factor (sigma-70 family)
VTEPGTDDSDPRLAEARLADPGADDGVAESVVEAPQRQPAEAVPVPEVLSFVDLYLRSFAEMVRLARVLVDSPETAEDLVQDAFVHLHRRWGGVRDPRAYLHRSVVNACRSHHRRAWRERSRPPRADDSSGPTANGGPGTQSEREVVDGDAEQGRADDAEVLGTALATLPYRQRAALVLRYYADLPDAQIAVALGCRPGTVASLVHRGLERLREVVDHD